MSTPLDIVLEALAALRMDLMRNPDNHRNAHDWVETLSYAFKLGATEDQVLEALGLGGVE